ncbi:MAG: polysaccharide deacetylase [Chloroflexi bacterium]|nr:MAG: polysaccharide deacetylase [Chloroflexota bacterium]
MMLTIVTYHYVRDLPRTRFPEIRGLATGRFEGQLDYLTKHYTFCHPDEVLAAVRGETVLPPNGCLLTFDDGLCDHYTTVFPRLEERGIPAVFFPAARPIRERTMLEVHMIHFVLASVPDPRRLVAETLNLVDQHRATHALPDRATLFRVCGAANRFDTLEVSFLKRLLQRELPALVRRDICRVLFQRHVTADLTSFAAELYMDLAQLRCLARNGMAIGGHGDVHDWLELLGPSEQREEIRQTLSLLESVAGQRPANWIMGYPYGSYSNVTLDLLREAGCAVGLTSETGLVSDLVRPLELCRLDTNDLPFAADAPVSEWTNRARGTVEVGAGQAG